MSTSDQSFDVVIAGGSLIGMALVVALRSALPGDFRIAMIERRSLASAAPADPRASALSLASRRFLEAVGVWPHIEAEAQPVTTIDITDATPASPIRPVLLHYDNTSGGEAA